jgi:YD repeat-containing protein
METPYGRTGFAFADEGQTRWLETTDPLGNKERLEYRNDWPGRGQAFGDPAEDVPSANGLLLFNNWLGARNTFYWDKKAYAEGAGDYSKAKILHWLHSPGNTWVTDRVLESEKKPFSSRVWYNYIGSTDMVYGPGTTALPTKVARVVDGPDGTRQTQLFQRTYNAVGNVLSETDPMGRVVNFTYDASGVNLLDVKSGNQTLMNATYSTNRLPLTLTDAAGQMTRFTYNAKGQPLTITDALGGVTTLTYPKFRMGDREPA